MWRITEIPVKISIDCLSYSVFNALDLKCVCSKEKFFLYLFSVEAQNWNWELIVISKKKKENKETEKLPKQLWTNAALLEVWYGDQPIRKLIEKGNEINLLFYFIHCLYCILKIKKLRSCKQKSYCYIFSTFYSDWYSTFFFLEYQHLNF